MFADNAEALKLLRNRVNEKRPPSIYDVNVIENSYAEIISLRSRVACLEAEVESMITLLNKQGVKS